METAAQYNRNGIIETTGSRRAIASARPNSSTHRMLILCMLSSARIERRTLPQIFVPMLPDMSFRHATVARLVGTAFLRRLFWSDAVLTPFSVRAGAACKGAAYRHGPANCRGASLSSRSKRSGPIAFARSLRPVVEYFGPKARCGGNRHRAGGQSQAGLSTADSRGGPLRQGAHCE